MIFMKFYGYNSEGACVLSCSELYGASVKISVLTVLMAILLMLPGLLTLSEVISVTVTTFACF